MAETEPRIDFTRARLLVVGDLMLDRYWFGDVQRISPEAPVPVVRVTRSDERLGGAANVAFNAACLGVRAVLVGAILCCIATAPLAWPFGASARDLALLALLGAVQLAIPCFLMIRAVRQLAPHEVALIGLLEVVLGPIWAWLGAGEAMSAATIQGGLLVLAALVGDTLLGRRAQPTAQAATQPAGLH